MPEPKSRLLYVLKYLHEEKVDLVPSNLDISALEMSLVTAMSRESVMKNYLSQVKDRYDYVLIDCMPSLGMITLNALTAADSVIIPVQAQYLPAKGMTQLLCRASMRPSRGIICASQRSAAISC